jgi:DNA mismatch repair ATPase MutS
MAPLREGKAVDTHAAYVEAKGRHPGMVILLRSASGYHTWGDDADAVRAAAWAKRFPHDYRPGPPAWAAFRTEQLDAALRRLLGAGLRVAILEQVEG